MADNPNMQRFPLGELTALCLRIGATTFGGGDPTIAALQRELVERRRVLPRDRFGVLFALARITPGTNMLAFCAGAGWMLSGWPGAAVAVTAMALPSAVIAVLLLYAFEELLKNAVAAAGIASMIAAAVGLMFAASYLLVRPHLGRSKLLRTALLAAGAFVVAWKQLLPPVQVLGLAAVVGYFWPEPDEQ
jgi:chromate transporter